MARIEKHRLVEVEVATAQQSGMPADSPEARELVDRLVTATAEFTAHVDGEYDVDELRRQMAAPDRTSDVHQHVDQFVSQFSGLFDRYVSLMATIDGTPQPDPGSVAETEDWIAAVLTADSGQPASGT
jgi:hypothetical protein